MSRPSTIPGPLALGTAADRGQLRHSVAATIRELIVAGRARPGELLRLAPLAAQMDISVTPVREALLLLAQEGWVVQEPNRGFRIVPLRRGDVEDSYFVQAAVAGELTARAAALATPDQVAELRALNARIEQDAAGDLLVEQLNSEFHQRLYDIAGAPRLAWFVGAASRFVPRRFWSTIPNWSELNRTAHGRIVELVAAGEGEAARIAMAGHILEARTLLLQWLDSIAFWEPE